MNKNLNNELSLLVKCKKNILSNGFTCLLAPDKRFPLISFQLWVKSGSVFEKQYYGSGISRFLEHLLLRGSSGSAGAGKYFQRLAEMGAVDSNAHTSHEYSAYFFTINYKYLAEGVKTLADLIGRPLFDEETVRREKKTIAAELERGSVNTAILVSDFLAKRYTVHPYKYPVLGYKDHFTKLTAADLKLYYLEKYCADNMVLSISGNFEIREAEKIISKNFAAFRYGCSGSDNFPEESPRTNAAFYKVGLNTDISCIKSGYLTCAVGDKDMYALDVLSRIIIQSRESFLNKKYIAAGLVSNCSCRSWTPLYKGTFELEYTPAAEQENDLHRKMTADLAAVKVTTDQLREAKYFIYKEVICQLQSIKGKAFSLASNEFFTGNCCFDHYYLQNIDAVTIADIERIINKYLSPDKAVTVYYKSTNRDNKKIKNLKKKLIASCS